MEKTDGYSSGPTPCRAVLESKLSVPRSSLPRPRRRDGNANWRDHRERRRRAFSVLKKVGLQHKTQAYPLELSGGEQQRVAIARAIVNDPALLLADEPTGNLDPEMAREIMKLFNDINNKGTTVLVATHNQEMIRATNKRVVMLRLGRFLQDSAPKQSTELV